jgi:hypothetical protein
MLHHHPFLRSRASLEARDSKAASDAPAALRYAHAMQVWDKQFLGSELTVKTASATMEAYSPCEAREGIAIGKVQKFCEALLTAA